MTSNSAAKLNIVGQQVRRHRMRSNLSQEELAARLQLAGWDLSRAGLSKIEAGLRRVNDAETWMLAHVLGCGLEHLFPNRAEDLLSVLRQGRN